MMKKREGYKGKGGTKVCLCAYICYYLCQRSWILVHTKQQRGREPCTKERGAGADKHNGHIKGDV